MVQYLLLSLVYCQVNFSDRYLREFFNEFVVDEFSVALLHLECPDARTQRGYAEVLIVKAEVEADFVLGKVEGLLHIKTALVDFVSDDLWILVVYYCK